MSKEFKRQDFMRYGKIGKNRKKIQRWKRPRGRHSKMRLQRKSYPAVVSSGYRTDKKEAGRVDGLLPILVHNVKELESAGKENIVILARVGAKKKLEIIKVAAEKKIRIHNVKEIKQ